MKLVLVPLWWAFKYHLEADVKRFGACVLVEPTVIGLQVSLDPLE